MSLPGPCTMQSTLEMSIGATLTMRQEDEAEGSWGTLHRVTGEEMEKKYELRGDSILIGRGSDMAIVLKDRRASNLHFKLERDGEGMGACIVDLSTNGTYVNGHRLVKNRSHRLHHGDEIGVIPDSKKRPRDGVKCHLSVVFHQATTSMSRRPTLLPSKPSPQNISWQKGSVIGKGGFGEVFMGINCQTGELLAVKTMYLSKGTDPTSIREEIDLLKRLRHAHIVRYLGSNANPESGSLDILMEYVPGGSVASLIEKFGRFHENVIASYLSQMLEGLQYLHDCMVIHRDIKGANILVSDIGCVKLTDFGSAVSLRSPKQDENRLMITGTPNWMAPEVVKASSTTFKSDIWSLGCVVLEMCTAKAPWHEHDFDNQIAVLYHIGRCKEGPKLPSRISVKLREILSAMLDMDPEERPSCRSLMRNPFLHSQSCRNDLEEGGLVKMESQTPCKKKPRLLNPSQDEDVPMSNGSSSKSMQYTTSPSPRRSLSERVNSINKALDVGLFDSHSTYLKDITSEFGDAIKTLQDTVSELPVNTQGFPLSNQPEKSSGLTGNFMSLET
eukprot:TRINITY_DN7829_c0_g1_i2.p1 TRINITY_DN7829_c0_g1~~TRINITY_DN7829_c0_g1_i2.p1  ORF type:complete len:558 (+),score=55.54 TRINITY_DN7829_c0_g1_i2:49-1722(+)